MKLKLTEDKKLFWSVDNEWQEVNIKSCFPVSHPNNFLSVLNKEGEELDLLENLDALSREERELLKRYFEFKNFNYRIHGVYSINEDFGVRHFEVKTQKGDRSFQTALDAWPDTSQAGLVIFTDIHGEQYWVENLDFGEKHLRSLI